MSLGQRIKEFRKILKITQGDMANKLNIDTPNISFYENGKTAPSIQTLELIRNAYNLNLDWLLSGEGDMFLDKEPKANKEQMRDDCIVLYPNFVATSSNEHHKVKVLGAISAGEPLAILDYETDRTLPIAKNLVSNPDDCYCFQVNGTSMEPEIADGDYVIISKIYDIERLDCKIIAVNSPEGLTLKELFYDTGTNQYFLRPINRLFKSIPLVDNAIILGCLKLIIRLY